MKQDITVSGAKRVAAIQSACALVKWFFVQMQKAMSSKNEESMQRAILQSIMTQFNANKGEDCNLPNNDDTIQDVQGKLKEFS